MKKVIKHIIARFKLAIIAVTFLFLTICFPLLWLVFDAIELLNFIDYLEVEFDKRYNDIIKSVI